MDERSFNGWTKSFNYNNVKLQSSKIEKAQIAKLMSQVEVIPDMLAKIEELQAQYTIAHSTIISLSIELEKLTGNSDPNN